MTFFNGRRAVTGLVLGWGLVLGSGSLSFGQTPSEDQMVTAAVSAYEDKLYPVAENQILEFLKKFPRSRHRLDMTYLLGRIYFLREEFRKGRDAFLNLINDNAVDKTHQTNGLFWLAESCVQLNQWEEAKAYYKEFIEKASDSPFREKGLFAIGLISLQEGALAEAESYFRKEITAFPYGQYRYRAQFYRGLVYGQLKNYHQAVQLLREALSAPSHFPASLRKEALFQLAENRLRLGQFQLALPHYEEFYETYPQDARVPFALYGAGWCQLNVGEKRAALKSFSELIKRFPKSDPSRHALYQIGEIHLEYKDYKKAREAFTQLVNEFPKSEMAASALVNLGWCYLNLGDVDEMSRVAHRLLKLPSDQIKKTLPQLLLGETHFQKGQYEEALPYFFNLLNTPSQRQNTLYKISRCYFYLEQYKDAITNVEILTLEYPDSGHLDECLYLRGVAAIRLGDIEKAIASFSEILKRGKHGSWTEAAQYELGKIYYERKDLKKAKDLFTRIVRGRSGTPTAIQASYYLGIISFKEDDSEDALEHLNVALESSSRAIQAECHYRLGEIYFEKKAYTLSLFHYQTIVESLSDQRAWVELALFATGNVRLELGESAEAGKAFQKVLEVSKDPDLREASERVLASIEKLNSKQ